MEAMIVPRWLASRAIQPEGRRLNDGWAISVIVDDTPHPDVKLPDSLLNVEPPLFCNTVC